MNTTSSGSKTPKEEALDYIWKQYRIYAATSRKHKKVLSSWRYYVLGLSIIGAILATICQQAAGLEFGNITWWPWMPRIMGGLSAIALGLAAFFSKEILSPDRERRWVRSRSLAEALKTHAYLFATGAPPYDTSEAIDLLYDNIKELLGEVTDLTVESISKAEGRKYIPPASLSVDQYIDVRITDQIDNFYTPRAAEHQTTMDKGRKISLGLGVTAVILGALGASGWTAGWVAVISTITASIAAYLYAGRYQYLVISYQASARRLGLLSSRWRSSGKTDADIKERNTFICACEDLISIENSAWMAEWTAKKPEEQEQEEQNNDV